MKSEIGVDADNYDDCNDCNDSDSNDDDDGDGNDSQNEMRTVWVHTIKFHDNYIENCAICRNPLIYMCIDCAHQDAKSPVFIGTTTIEEAKDHARDE